MNDDLISRQGLMNTLHIKEDCQDCEYSNGNFCNLSPDFVNACEAICDAPSAERRGHWIKHENKACWVCSECGTDDYYAYERNSVTGKYELQDKYCPNCGAAMEEEE